MAGSSIDKRLRRPEDHVATRESEYPRFFFRDDHDAIFRFAT